MHSLTQVLLPLLATTTSLLGAWLASSIMAALKMPLALVIFSGLLMLPILPALWIISQQRFSWKYRLPFL